MRSGPAAANEHGHAGGWLFGDFSIADAMFAPVFFRFQTYGAALSAASQTYLSHALQDPDLRAWQDAASQEGHPLAEVDRIGASGACASIIGWYLH